MINIGITLGDKLYNFQHLILIYLSQNIIIHYISISYIYITYLYYTSIIFIIHIY